MTTSFYLEHYLDSLTSLPGELRRNFTLMHDMDDKNQNILRDVDAASDEYLRKVKDLNSDDRKVEMEKIQRMFKKAKEFGDEKVSIAIQTYEMVDKHIRRLDGDLAKFEAEMREKGRLSQTETEDEDDNNDENGTDDNGNKKASTGGRGRKNKAGQTPSSGSMKKKGQKIQEKERANSKNVSRKIIKGIDSGIDTADDSTTALAELQLEVIDMPVDPNEPTYCICKRVSYGEMIGCDNENCSIEWFHFGCVNVLTKPPKGNWYCPDCLPLFRKD